MTTPSPSDDPLRHARALLWQSVIASFQMDVLGALHGKLDELEERLGRELPAVRRCLERLVDGEEYPTSMPGLPSGSPDTAADTAPPAERKRPGRKPKTEAEPTALGD